MRANACWEFVGVNRLQLNWVYGCCFCLEKEELFPQFFFLGGGSRLVELGCFASLGTRNF